jgi:hypothetical protein
LTQSIYYRYVDSGSFDLMSRGFDGAACAASPMLKRHETLRGSEKVGNGHDVSCLALSKLTSPSFLLPEQFGSDRRLSPPSLNISELKFAMASVRRNHIGVGNIDVRQLHH